MATPTPPTDATEESAALVSAEQRQFDTNHEKLQPLVEPDAAWERVQQLDETLALLKERCTLAGTLSGTNGESQKAALNLLTPDALASANTLSELKAAVNEAIRQTRYTLSLYNNSKLSTWLNTHVLPPLEMAEKKYAAFDTHLKAHAQEFVQELEGFRQAGQTAKTDKMRLAKAIADDATDEMTVETLVARLQEERKTAEMDKAALTDLFAALEVSSLPDALAFIKERQEEKVANEHALTQVFEQLGATGLDGALAALKAKATELAILEDTRQTLMATIDPTAQNSTAAIEALSEQRAAHQALLTLKNAQAEQIQELEAAVGNLETCLEQAQTQGQTAVDALEAEKASHRVTESSSQEHAQARETLQQQILELKALMATQEELLSQKERNLSDEKARASQATAQAQKLGKALEQERKKGGEQGARLTELTRELGAAQEEGKAAARQHTQAVAELRKQVKALEKDVTAAQREGAAQVRKLEAAHTKATTELARKAQAAQKAALDSQLHEHQAELQSLHSELAQLKGSTEQALRDQKLEHMTQTTKALRAQEATIATLRLRVQELEQKLSSTTSSAEQAQADKTAFMEFKAKARTSWQEKKKLITTLQTRIEELEREQSGPAARIKVLEAECKTLQEQNRALEQKLLQSIQAKPMLTARKLMQTAATEGLAALVPPSKGPQHADTSKPKVS